MSKKYLVMAALGLVLLMPGMQVEGNTLFYATLEGSQEVPPVTTNAYGFATLELNAAQTRLTIDLTIYGLDLNNVTGLHIHRAPFGVNGGVVFGMIGPNNDTSGDLLINPAAGTVFSAWDMDEGNAGTTLTAELPFLFAEGLYINVHTPAFPGGEIRGQIVPEPAILCLLAAGGLGFLRKRRRITV